MKAKINQFPYLRPTDGFSYVEVLVAVILIALTLVPAINAVFGGVQGGGIHTQRTQNHYRITGLLEEVLARPFDELQAEADAAGGPGAIVAAYSDAAGTAQRRLVYLARYDGDNADADDDYFTGVDDGLLWVRVQIENTLDGMETLTKR